MKEELERTWDEVVVAFDLNEGGKPRKPQTVDAWVETLNRSPHSTGGIFSFLNQLARLNISVPMFKILHSFVRHYFNPYPANVENRVSS